MGNIDWIGPVRHLAALPKESLGAFIGSAEEASPR